MTVVPQPGHFIPLIRLAEALEAAGHFVTFLTLHYNKELLEKMIQMTGLKAEIRLADKEGQYSF